jgi:hypothetical protein
MVSPSTSWMSYAAAGRRLGKGPWSIRLLAERGTLTTRTLPGCRPQVLRDDVERLAVDCIMPRRDPDLDNIKGGRNAVA